MLSPRVRFATVIPLITLLLLVMVRSKTAGDFLLFDRLFAGGGLWQIIGITLFSAWMAYRFYDRHTRVALRERLWLLFGVLFFVQLLLGITIDSLFLLSGELHFPIPSVILTGTLYRMSIGFMPILFVATVLLSGGAWCSQLCYFGAFDAVASGRGKHSSSPRLAYRLYVLFGFVFIAILLRMLAIPTAIGTWMGAVSGLVGLIIILFVSRRQRTMAHCSFFCPLGTVVSYLKYLSPFRYRISKSCTKCMACTTVCRYGALSKRNIEQGKPSIGCTMCGNCSVKCKHNAFEYRLFGISSTTAEHIFAGIVVIIYSLFLCVARV